MAMKHMALLLFLAFVPALAHAQTRPQAHAPKQEGQAAPSLEPPKAVSETTVAYPDQAPAHTQPVLVRVKLRVGADGHVQKVELVSPPQAVFDDAVIRAAEKFEFYPARYGGKPVPVEITFSHTFLPPPPPPAPTVDGGPPLVSTLRGKLVEKGTRVPVQGATVSVQIGERHYDAPADTHGRFRVQIPEGQARITVHAVGYKAFLQVEKVDAKQELAVAYYVERERYDPYEIVVFGEQRREELSRITLRGAEIKQVPGTFGDPFRVVQTLPGVSSIMSLLPFPVVRGASPGSTGILIDGTRVPMLYHLLAGPSVIHPEFIDEVQFYPGGAPVLYGGYTAGIIDGRTRRSRPDEKLVDIDLNLLQSGALVRYPIEALGITATAAARYGYPGGVISLATNQLSLSYWDYQLRLDGGNARNGWTVFAFGAKDELDTPVAGTDPNNPVLGPALKMDFHRLDLRAQHGSGKFDAFYRVVGGIDQTAQGSAAAISTWVLEPSTRFRWRWPNKLDLIGGLEGSLHAFDNPTTAAAGSGGPAANAGISSLTDELSTQYLGSALTEALWRPSPNWLIRPGARVDVRHDDSATQTGFDPRLAVRYRLTTPDLPAGVTPTDDKSWWIKAGVGVYHEPPRFALPLPGLDAMPLKYGLLRSIQSSIGLEIPVAEGFTATVEGFYNDMDPVVFDLATNAQSAIKTAAQTSDPFSGASGANPAQAALDRLTVPQIGRSFGVEALIRRQVRNGLYGWLSYTLSLSERKSNGVWSPYDYDRTHLLNVVAGLPLPRNWDVGLRLTYQSGLPATTTYGYNTARGDGYFRMDLRIDKRAVWNKWLLDFYVDLTNATLYPEEVVPGTTIRYVLPTVGIRARL
jgi:TonB family protein